MKARGFAVVEIPPEPDGSLDVQKLIDAVDKSTVLAACMAVNNETGAVQDIARLAAGVKAKTAAPPCTSTRCRPGCASRWT